LQHGLLPFAEPGLQFCGDGGFLLGEIGFLGGIRQEVEEFAFRIAARAT